LAVFYPLSVWYSGVDLTFDSIVLFDIFPALGLVGFSVMWLHVVGGPFKSQLEKLVDFEQYVFYTSVVVFISLILHPTLLILALALNGGSFYDYTPEGKEYLIDIAIIAWVIFITYDILRVLKNRGVFIKHWEVIRLISTLGFFLVLVHSLGVGRDLQGGPLRVVWMFYGFTAGVAAFYSYVYKPLIAK